MLIFGSCWIGRGRRWKKSLSRKKMKTTVKLMSKNTQTAESIMDAKRRKRQEAADFARASVGLEGFSSLPKKQSPADAGTSTVKSNLLRP